MSRVDSPHGRELWLVGGCYCDKRKEGREGSGGDGADYE